MNKDLEILISPGLWSKRQKIVISVILATLLILIGFVAGTYITIKTVAEVAGGFVDEDLVRQAIYQYQNNIGGCYPSIFENALNNSNQGK